MGLFSPHLNQSAPQAANLPTGTAAMTFSPIAMDKTSVRNENGGRKVVTRTDS
jgi:hypothetical protein